MLKSPILSTTDWIEKLSSKRNIAVGGKLLAMYSSYVGGITTDVVHMNIPLDDHMVHRGHGVYDSGCILHGNIVDGPSHVERLIQSAKDAGIPCKWSKDQILSITNDVVASSRCRNGSYRIFVSSGPGSFGIHSYHCEEPSLYVIVYTTSDLFLKPGTPVSEVTVSTDEIPMKPPSLAHIKSVNYLSNVMLADIALQRGGFVGIWVDPFGNVKEGSIASISIVTNDGVFVTPSFDDILKGCTVQRLASIAQANNLVQAAEVRNVTKDELYGAAEVILSGGDINVYPVVKIDGRTIGSGSIGPVCRELAGYLNLEATGV